MRVRAPLGRRSKGEFWSLRRILLPLELHSWRGRKETTRKYYVVRSLPFPSDAHAVVVEKFEMIVHMFS